MRAAVLSVFLLLAGCGGSSTGEACADVIGAVAESGDEGVWSFDVTVRSADTGWEKYADAWQVVAPDGTVLGTRQLTHPHVEEQPFTRSLGGVEIPSGVQSVTVRARDSVAGFCGEEAEVELSR
jgi:hypothetical protein